MSETYYLICRDVFGRKGAFGSVFKEIMDGTEEVAVKHMHGDVEVSSLKTFATEVSPCPDTDLACKGTHAGEAVARTPCACCLRRFLRTNAVCRWTSCMAAGTQILSRYPILEGSNSLPDGTRLDVCCLSC